jgi:hypothetical protein
MALACARCGAQNPDGNLFCSTCGNPLTAAAAAPPVAAPGWAAAAPPAAAPGPPAAAPGWAVVAPPTAARAPVPPAAPAWGVVAPAAPPAPAAAMAYASPPVYASPYYSPTGSQRQAPVHRTPWTLIIAAVVGLIVVMAGCGTAVALLTNKASITGGITSDLPSPTPAGSPSPLASPSAIAGATSASNDYLTIPVPPGWQVAHKDSQVIALLSPNGLGSITVASGPLNPPSTAQAGKDQIDKALTTKYPGAQNCPGTRPTNGTLNGASGIFWTLCYTVVSNGNSFPAASALFVGVNSNGSIAYLLELATLAGSMDTFRVDTKPIVAGIVWKSK